MTQPQSYPPTTLAQWLPNEPAAMLRNMSVRYSIAESVILSLSPVLFHMVAQASLAHRRAALRRMTDAHDAMSGDGEAFLLHGAGMFPEDRFAEAEDAEQVSMAAEDILGTLIADASGSLADSATGPEEAAFARHNPLAAYIKSLSSDVVEALQITDQIATYRLMENPITG